MSSRAFSSLRATRSRGVSRRGTRPTVEPLERRELYAVAPTDYEQYMLALINRARANPAAEGRRLYELAQSDPVLRNAVRGWDLDKFVATISSFGPRPPLAFNTRLIEAARAQNQRMLAINRQQHSPSGFLNNAKVATASDRKVYYNTARAAWATGENIFAFSANVYANSLKDYVDYFHAGFAIDWGNPDFGHLKNIMAPSPSVASAKKFPFREIGVGLLENAFPTVPADPNPPNAGLNVGPVLVTQEFGWRSTSNPFLTGIVYDDRNRNSFYDPAEGYGGVTIKAVARKGRKTYQTTTWDSGGYSLALPAGIYTVTASGGNLGETRTTVVKIAKDNVGWDVMNQPVLKADVPIPADFDGDGKSDLATYGAERSSWAYARSSDGSWITAVVGSPGTDVPVPGRYDGGTAAVFATYRPSDALWTIAGPTGVRTTTFGRPGDVPEPADYDGDGETDLAVFRPASGEWSVLRSSDQVVETFAFGWAGLDQPVPADYDGDGKADPAVFRPTTAEWFVRRSSNGQVATAVLGQPGLDQPKPADYDGDGEADFAVFRPTTAEWIVRRSSDQNVTTTQFGSAGTDLARPADYDGDGKADFAVFRPAAAEWFLLQSTAGFATTTFGQGGTPRPAGSSPATVPAAWLDWTPPPAGKRESWRDRAKRVASVPRGPLTSRLSASRA